MTNNFAIRRGTEGGDGTAVAGTTCADEGDTLRSLTSTQKEDSLPESEERRETARDTGDDKRRAKKTHTHSESERV